MYKIFGMMLISVGMVSAQFDVQVERNKQAKLPIGIVLIAPVTAELKSVARVIESDMAASGQFDIQVERSKQPDGTAAIKKLAKRGIALAVFLQSSQTHEIEWRVYDTISATMVQGKRVKRGDISRTHWAHHIADQIWPVLTSEGGSFSSVIVACKRMAQPKGKRPLTHIFAMSPTYGASGHEASVLTGNFMNFAPRWHPTKPQVFYSQHAPFNVSLRAVDEHDRHRLITSFEGQNMTPALSKRGRVIVSLSRGADAHLYEYVFDPKARKGRFVQLTKGSGQYISPSFLDENHIAICYIAASKRPKVGVLALDSGKIKWLDTAGHAVAPCASPDGSKISYSQSVNGQLQIFVYDRNTQKHRQLTRGSGHKDESSWSPCGSCVACSVESGPISRIAIIHVPSQRMRYITPANEWWNFPAWSPVYKNTIPFMPA